MSNSNNKKSSVTKTNITVRSTLNLISYLSVFCIGVALTLNYIFRKVSLDGGARIAGAFGTVAECLAYLVVSVYSFYFARTKRNVAYIICWAFAVALIVVFKIL